MDYKIEERSTFYLAGISVRTQNIEDKAHQDIMKLWGRFFAECIQEKLPNILSEEIYNLYIDYESDHLSPYTVIVGCRVSSLEDLPDGLVGIEVPGGKFASYTAIGKLPEAVQTTWGKIYENPNIKRNYKGDYDIYDGIVDVTNAMVTICVAVD